jgi:hypothetical protein
MARVNTSDGLSRSFNVLHYEMTLLSNANPEIPPPATVFADDYLPVLAANLSTKLKNTWVNATSEKMTFDGVTTQGVYPDPRSRPYTFLETEEKNGGIAGDMLPMQDAMTILKRTIFGTRWGLGRYFHSGIPESVQDKGITTDAYRTLVDTYASELADTISATFGAVTAVFVPILFSLSPGPVVVPRKTFLSSAICSDNVIKTQRRRRPGKGI